MNMPIRIESIEDAKEINLHAASLPFKTEVHGMIEMVDARSLLGLIALIGRTDLHYVAPDHCDPYMAYDGMEKFHK